MLDLSINTISIDSTAIRDLTVAEVEMMAVDHSVAAVLENLEQGGLIIWVGSLGKGAVGDEVLTIDTMVSGPGESESLDVEGCLSCLHAATKTRLALIDWVEVDARVLVLPEAAKGALHVTSGQTENEGKLDNKMASTYTAWMLFSLDL